MLKIGLKVTTSQARFELLLLIKKKGVHKNNFSTTPLETFSFIQIE